MNQVPAGMSRFSIASPLAGGAVHAIGSGLFHTLLPLKLIAEGHGPNAIGLVIGAEGVGFLLGCIGSVRLIRSVGEVRAYAALSASSAVLILSLGHRPAHRGLHGDPGGCGLFECRPGRGDRELDERHGLE